MPLANPTLKTGVTAALIRDYLLYGKHKADQKIMSLGVVRKGDDMAEVWYCPDSNEIVVVNG